MLVRINRFACIVEDEEALIAIPNPMALCANCDGFVNLIETPTPKYMEVKVNMQCIKRASIHHMRYFRQAINSHQNKYTLKVQTGTYQ